MTVRISTNRRKRRKSNSKSKQCKKLNLQKPSGVIGPRVKRVGGEKFAIVCVDPAKHRSEWMMADFFKPVAKAAGMIGRVNSRKTALRSTTSKRTPPGMF